MQHWGYSSGVFRFVAVWRGRGRELHNLSFAKFKICLVKNRQQTELLSNAINIIRLKYIKNKS